MIKAPYNFVPLNDKVFYPPWANQVSHDIPFSDGESGEIEVTITAHSPIFIRDHENKEEFCNHNGTYYIPGSSLKGMVRNVLEIMSFGKMKFVDDRAYSLRDLYYPPYTQAFRNNQVMCGWLFQENGQYYIQNCGIPYRISYDRIEEQYSSFQKSLFLISEDALQNRDRIPTEVKENIAIGTFNDRNSPYKNAIAKYSLIGGTETLNDVHRFSVDYEDEFGKTFVYFDSDGDIQGRLVLTGHPTARIENIDTNSDHTIKPSGKISDFVFPEPEDENALPVDKKVFENFKFAYFDGEHNESSEWDHWKDQLKQGRRVPVFFHVRVNQNGQEEILHFGLSYLYKLPYKHTIHHGLNNSYKHAWLDLAETMFGHVKDKGLKGRVHFDHFISKNAQRNNRKVKYDLAMPRASYYPIYLRQNGTECTQNHRLPNRRDYITYMDDEFVLAGWKRYPIHERYYHGRRENCQEGKLGTCFYPIRENAVFSGKIRFHNLKKEEIGALLSALLFHNTSDTYHNIGMAKAYGLGKITIQINSVKTKRHNEENITEKNIDSYLVVYEKMMRLFIENWHRSIQLRELVTMASVQDDTNLRYMPINGRDSYVKNKKSKSYLCMYSQLPNVQAKYINSLTDDNSYTIEEVAGYLGTTVDKVQAFCDSENIDFDGSFVVAQMVVQYFE